MPTTSPAPRRHRATALATALVLGLGVTVVATGPTPLGAVTAAPVAPVAPVAPTTTVTGPGSMDTAEIALSGPTPAPVPVPAPSGRAAADPAPTAPAAGATGGTTTHELLPGTQMVAVSWDGTQSAPDGAVSLRSRGPQGWTGWTTIHPEIDDQGGEGAGRVGTDVVWLGSEGADTVEVRVDIGPLVALELLTMRYHEGEPRAGAAAPESRAAAGATARPAIRPRSDWASGGWKSSISGCGSAPQVASSLKHAVVHHTASTNSYSAAQVPGLLDGIYRYHTQSLAWCDTAYNFIVDKFGTIWQGRSGDVTTPVIGGHAKGFNTGSVGVSLLGQFEPGASPAAATPTTAMMDATARLLAWKLSLHGLDPTGTTTIVSGGSTRYTAGRAVTLPIINHHQQTSTTACPGAGVITWMPALRDAVERLTGTSPPPPPSTSWSPFGTVEDLVWRQFSDFRRDPGTYDERRWWTVNLTDGKTNRNALVANLLHSDRVDTRSASVVRLYLAYFGRVPDHAGIRFWWGQMDGGLSLRTVSKRFTGSPEFRATYGGLTDEAFVRMVYRNVLDREAEPAGLTFWVDQIRRGKENRGGVMVKFSESQENRAAVRDVVDVILAHEVMLGRAISTSGLWTGVDRVRRGGLGAFLGPIFTSNEYRARVG